MRIALHVLAALSLSATACEDSSKGDPSEPQPPGPAGQGDVMGQPSPPDTGPQIMPGPMDAGALPDISVGEIVAERIMTWVCDSGFGAEALDEDLELAEVAGGDAVIRIDPAGEPCTFHLSVSAPGEETTRLTETPSGYLLAAGVERDGVRAVCASRIEHRAAAEEGQEDPDGRMVRRETTGVSVICAVGAGETWTAPFEVVASSGEFAPWVVALTDDGDGGYTLTYDRDFSFQFLNLTPGGRPESDGSYTVGFSVDAEGAVTVAEPEKLADELVGAPEPEDPEQCPAGVIDPDDPRCAPRCGDGTCDPDEACDTCEDCGPCALMVDDADEPGYAEVEGEWANAEGHDDFSRWTEAGRATFTFDAMLPGWKSLSVHHPRDANSATAAVYRIIEGEQEVARFVEDQRGEPSEWVLLGRFPSRGDFLVELSSAGAGRLRADAIRVEQIEAPPPVVDDGDGLYAETEGRWSGGAGGHDGDHRSSVGGVATFTLPIQPGVHQLAVYVPDAPQASTRADLTIASDGRFVAGMTVDQRSASGWLELGRYRLDGQRVTLTWTGTDDLPVLADAARVGRHADLNRAGEVAVDDGDPLFLVDGQWAPAAGGGVGGDARWSRDPVGRARWQFSGLAPDFYDVLVAWPADPANTTVATYSFSAGGGEIGQVVADQTAPNPGWLRIGTVWAASPVIEVSLTREGRGTVYADAIKLVSTSCEDCTR